MGKRKTKIEKIVPIPTIDKLEENVMENIIENKLLNNEIYENEVCTYADPQHVFCNYNSPGSGKSSLWGDKFQIGQVVKRSR